MMMGDDKPLDELLQRVEDLEKAVAHLYTLVRTPEPLSQSCEAANRVINRSLEQEENKKQP